jgi:phosphatidylinositol 3,5-bisphosphate 5-phosphatase
MEQILQLDIGSQKTFASYVQMRGSIPTYWYQETSVTNPKPPILVDRIDPNYLATQEHFSDLIRRYSLPIIVLDLVKHNERRKRECIGSYTSPPYLLPPNPPSPPPILHNLFYVL